MDHILKYVPEVTFDDEDSGALRSFGCGIMHDSMGSRVSVLGARPQNPKP